MKRVVFLTILCAACFFAHALTHYSIHDWSGDVQYKTMKTQQWLPADKTVTLSVVDSIRIGENSHVNITNIECNKRIPSLSVGVLSINQIVKEAEKADSKSIFEVIICELKKKKEGENNPNSMSSLGAGQRELQSIAGNEKELAKCLAWIGRQAVDKQLKDTTKDVILHRNTTEKGVSFAIENKSDITYCVNVLHVNISTKTPSLCYVINEENQNVRNIIIPPTCCYGFSEMVFPNTAGDLYILIATEETYDTEMLNEELLWNKIDSIPESVGMRIKYTL